jgi:hypothetical protein
MDNKKEVGRMLLGDIQLIEYEHVGESEPSYFVQSGVVGFLATKQELHDIYSLLNYYFNIDSINNTVISVD